MDEANNGRLIRRGHGGASFSEMSSAPRRLLFEIYCYPVVLIWGRVEGLIQAGLMHFSKLAVNHASCNGVAYVSSVHFRRWSSAVLFPPLKKQGLEILVPCLVGSSLMDRSTRGVFVYRHQ
jgi:hypothetical protein